MSFPQLYGDEYMTITAAYIQINRYYFPLATSKLILLTDITELSIQDATKIKTLWGVSRAFPNHWFHMDRQRPSKLRFISIRIKGKKLYVGLTPARIVEAFNVLKGLLQVKNQEVTKVNPKMEQTDQIIIERVYEISEEGEERRQVEMREMEIRNADSIKTQEE